MNRSLKRKKNEGSRVKVKARKLMLLVVRTQRPLVVKRAMMASRSRLRSRDRGNTSSRMAVPTSNITLTTLKIFKRNQT